MKILIITLLASLSFGYAADFPKAKSAQSQTKQEEMMYDLRRTRYDF